MAKGGRALANLQCSTSMTDISNPFASLSPRQLEILRLVSQHLSSKEISRELGISPATVDSHIASAIERLGLGSRREAAAALERSGLLGHRSIDSSDMPDVSDPHHGGNLSPQLTTIAGEGHSLLDDGDSHSDAVKERKELWKWRFRRRIGSPPSGQPKMGDVLYRCLLDALFILVFFATVSAAAYGVHSLVVVLEAYHIDPVVLSIFTWTSYVLAGLDAVGVVCATGLLTFRFIRAIWRADD